MEPALHFAGCSLYPIVYTKAICALELMEDLGRPRVPAKGSGSWGIPWPRIVHSPADNRYVLIDTLYVPIDNLYAHKGKAMILVLGFGFFIPSQIK